MRIYYDSEGAPWEADFIRTLLADDEVRLTPINWARAQLPARCG